MLKESEIEPCQSLHGGRGAVLLMAAIRLEPPEKFNFKCPDEFYGPDGKGDSNNSA